MPGPGGGGRSGGGGRGGGFGGGGRGGFSGGGRGGGFHGGPHYRPPHRSPHRPYHRPFMGGFWFFGPRHHHHHHYGGGCFSAMLAPVILCVVAVVLLFALLVSGVGEIARGGTTQYDEQKFQAYADQKYAEVFEDTAYEDNILLVVLTAEDAYDYKYIAWVGDHVAHDVNALFGDDYTVLGQAMDRYISDTNYTYSLDSDLGNVIKAMAQKIDALDLENNLTCQEGNGNAPSELYNETKLPMTEETVNNALTQFTEKTGIACSIVVEDMDDVFDRGLSGSTVILLVLLAIVVILLVVSFYKKRRSKQNPEDNPNRNNRYKDPF